MRAALAQHDRIEDELDVGATIESSGRSTAIVIADRARTAGPPASKTAGPSEAEWHGEDGLALVRRVADLNNVAPIVCAGANQALLIEKGANVNQPTRYKTALMLEIAHRPGALADAPQLLRTVPPRIRSRRLAARRQRVYGDIQPRGRAALEVRFAPSTLPNAGPAMETYTTANRTGSGALGYWNDPEATARVFRANPLRPAGAPDTERVVFSGDLVRRDAEGFLYFVGRRDRMIKTLGYRVSPDEVVEALHASGEIAEALVTAEPDEARGERIVAHVVLTQGGSIERLEAFCRAELPRYLQPSRFEQRSELPRTASGKYDPRALQAAGQTSL